MSMFYGVLGQVGVLLDHARTSTNGFDGTIWAIQRRRDTAFHGDYCIGRRFRLVSRPWLGSDFTKAEKVETSSIDSTYSAVAAATGRGFKSRRPDRIFRPQMNTDFTDSADDW